MFLLLCAYICIVTMLLLLLFLFRMIQLVRAFKDADIPCNTSASQLDLLLSKINSNNCNANNLLLRHNVSITCM